MTAREHDRLRRIEAAARRHFACVDADRVRTVDREAAEAALRAVLAEPVDTLTKEG